MSIPFQRQLNIPRAVGLLRETPRKHWHRCVSGRLLLICGADRQRCSRWAARRLSSEHCEWLLARRSCWRCTGVRAVLHPVVSRFILVYLVCFSLNNRHPNRCEGASSGSLVWFSRVVSDVGHLVQGSLAVCGLLWRSACADPSPSFELGVRV